MASSGTVNAMWVGPYGSRLPDGTILETDITVVELPRGEAEASDNWKVVKRKPTASNEETD